VRVGQHDWWPVFNVADSSIVVGVALIAVFYALGRRPHG
jgi:lipoprotein signal peptidase